jgi:hypothetical protein
MSTAKPDPRRIQALNAKLAGLVLALATAACGSAGGPDCAASLLYRASGYTLKSPAGTTFQPTVIFSDVDEQYADYCHYARNQGDTVCTEPGDWIDNAPGQMDGTLTVIPRTHACGTFTAGQSYQLQYSFTKYPGILWIESWSSNQ